jgi:hypothetical protein
MPLNMIVNILILLSSVSLFADLPLPIARLCGALQAFVLPGYAVIRLLGDRNRSWSDGLFYSILFSPALFALTAVGSWYIASGSGNIGSAARLSAGVWYAVFALSLIVSGPKSAGKKPAVPYSIVMASFAYCALLLIAYSKNGFLLSRSDAWYHASVTGEILARGIPPGEPWLADLPIRYMWIYHIFNASWKSISGSPIFNALASINIVSALALPYIVGRYVGTLTSNRRYALLATLMTIAGFESASWILWPIGLGKAFFGDVKGMAEITWMVQEAADQIGGINVIYFLRPAWTWMVNLSDKFLTITAFGYSLCLFTACLNIFRSRRYRELAPLRSATLGFIMMLATVLFHMVTGMALIFTVIGSSVLVYIWSRFAGTRIRLSSCDISFPVAGALAAAIGLFYYFSLGSVESGGSTEATRYLSFGFKNAATIVTPLVVLLCPTLHVIRKLVRPEDRNEAELASWVLCLLMLCLFVNLPSVNESKLIFPFFLVLGPLVSVEALRLTSESRRLKKLFLAGWLIILFIVPPVLTYRGFVGSRPRNPVEVRQYSLSATDREVFDWIAANTSMDAVVAERNIFHLAPVLSARRNLYSTGGVLSVLGYAGQRHAEFGAIKETLYGEKEPSAADLEMAGTLGRDLYITVWEKDAADCPWMEGRFTGNARFFSEVFSNEKVKLFRFEHGYQKGMRE